MLEQQRIAAESGVEDADTPDAFDEFQDQSHGQHRHGQQENEASGVDGPDEDRQPPPVQPRRPQAMDGDDKVEASEDRRKAGNNDPYQRGNNIVCDELVV